MEWALWASPSLSQEPFFPCIIIYSLMARLVSVFAHFSLSSPCKQIFPTPFPVPAAPPATTRTQAAQGWEVWSHTPRNAPDQARRLHACLLVLPLCLLFFSLTFCLRRAPPSLLITNHSHQPPRKHSGATWLLTGH